MGSPGTLIGIDLDNTIISYDVCCRTLAMAKGWLPAETPAGKRAVRDALRAQPGGEMRWRELQALAYGPRMDLAEPMPGALDFVRACRAAGARTVIVSHKTRFAKAFDTGVNLRQAAMGWLQGNGFLDAATTGLTPDDVWFESERAAKNRRIAALGCNVFIDDLEEVFADPSFPAGVEKILLAPAGLASAGAAGALVCAGWPEIAAHVFPR